MSTYSLADIKAEKTYKNNVYHLSRQLVSKCYIQTDRQTDNWMNRRTDTFWTFFYLGKTHTRRLLFDCNMPFPPSQLSFFITDRQTERWTDRRTDKFAVT